MLTIRAGGSELCLRIFPLLVYAQAIFHLTSFLMRSTPTFLSLWLTLTWTLLVGGLSAQCVPDSLVSSTPGGIYPPVLPPAEGCEYYEEIISFQFPQDTTVMFAGNTITVNFNYFTIDSITGLPAGLDWECNLAPACRYVVHPDSSDLDTVGCVTLFGTPALAATYNLTVHLTANADVFGVPTDQASAFSQPLLVSPCVFEGECYTLSLSDNCEPTTLTLTNNVPSQGQPGFAYDWEINGPSGLVYQTSDEDPFPQMLPEGGDYLIDYRAEIDTVGFILQQLRIINVGCSDLTNGPDLYWNLQAPDGTIVFDNQSTPVSNATLPLDMGISNLLLDTGQWRIQVWDDELLGGPTGCASGGNNSGANLFFTVPPAQTGTFNLISGDLEIEFTLDNPISTITCRDTIRVDSLPGVPTLARDGDPLAVDTSAYCVAGGSLLSTDSRDSLQWFLDGVPITGANDTLLLVTEPGLYSVEAIDRSTFCRSSSAAVYLDSLRISIPAISYDSLSEAYSVDAPVATQAYQWYTDMDVLVAEGDSFAPATNGSFYAVAIDTATGCSSAPTQVFSFVSGLASPLSLTGWRVSPNPTQGLLYLQAELLRPVSVALAVYDLAGRQLLQRDLGPTHGAVETILDLSQLPAGVYLLELTAGQQRSLQRVMRRD